jgi:hypothetical protein
MSVVADARRRRGRKSSVTAGDVVPTPTPDEIIQKALALALATEAAESELGELAEIERTMNPRRSVRVTDRVHIPGETMAKLAGILRVPDANVNRFCEDVRCDLDIAESSAKKIKRALVAEDTVVKRSADDLALALAVVNEDTKAFIERHFSLLRKRLLICERRSVTSLVTVRPIQVDDVIEVLQSIASATCGPIQRAAGSSYRRRPGRPHGTALTGKGLRHVVQRLLERAEQAGSKRIGVKRLIRAVDLLGPYLPNALSRRLPERTIKRFKAQFERQARRRAAQAAKRKADLEKGPTTTLLSAFLAPL